MTASPRTSQRRPGPAGAFTLVEVLATMALAAIVLPPVMEGISLCLTTGLTARRQAEATSLAQGKLAELSAAGQLQQASLQGDFRPDWPDYRWEAAVSNYEATLKQIRVTVFWSRARREYSVTLTSLAYQGGTGP